MLRHLPFAPEGLTGNGKLYSIPVLVCGSFLICDRDCEAPATGEHITDLCDAPDIPAIDPEDPMNGPPYEDEAFCRTFVRHGMIYRQAAGQISLLPGKTG